MFDAAPSITEGLGWGPEILRFYKAPQGTPVLLVCGPRQAVRPVEADSLLLNHWVKARHSGNVCCGPFEASRGSRSPHSLRGWRLQPWRTWKRGCRDLVSCEVDSERGTVARTPAGARWAPARPGRPQLSARGCFTVCLQQLHMQGPALCSSFKTFPASGAKCHRALVCVSQIWQTRSLPTQKQIHESGISNSSP
nr:uncharacterized protein LOC110133899 isoform X3 [Odocoileus virginianus texanus]